MRSLVSPIDPEHARPSGGVGILARAPLQTIPIKARTKAYLDAYATGRLAVYQVDMQPTAMLCAIIYGWTGALGGNRE